MKKHASMITPVLRVLEMNIRTSLAVLTLAVLFVSVGSAQECDCWTCSVHRKRDANLEKFWEEIRSRRDRINLDRKSPPDGSEASPPGMGSMQVVFLDFDSGDNGSVNYTSVRREQIQSQMETIYGGFNVSFVQTRPGGDYSTITFNEGGPGGIAEDIDFRNLNKNDNAVVNISGLGVSGDDVISSSAVIGSHELGHLLGFRHADSFGPIGNGILSGFAGFYSPTYPGPGGADESFDHIMITPNFGSSINDTTTPSWLSERSANKLKFAEFGTTTVESAGNNNSIANAQSITLENFTVPNNIVSGDNAGIGNFSVDMATVEGNLTGNSDTSDYFGFPGQAGDLINIEVISAVPNRLAGNSINATVSVFDSTGSFVNYFGTNAFNNDELKASDAVIYDLELPSDDMYFVEVAANAANDSGDYEVYITRFNGAAKDILLGDVNCDGSIDLLDVAPFVALLSNGEFEEKADINEDGFVNLLDVNPFVALLSGS